METYVKIDKDTLKRVYTDENIIDLKKIRARINEIDIEIDNAKLEPKLVNNDIRDQKIEQLKKEKDELQAILNK